MRSAERIWKKQNEALRNPLQVISSSIADSGITADSLTNIPDTGFVHLLRRLGITLLITREYENMAVALYSGSKGISQTFMPLPHPSGIAVDRKKNAVYIAATRNPNQLIEFCPSITTIPRKEIKTKSLQTGYLLPSRIKFYPGCYYFHDLAIIGKDLYANSVGMNGVIKVDWARSSEEDLTWFPNCTKDKKGNPLTDANYIQLNSIAAGKSINSSFFTASGSKIIKQRPGQADYPVDKKGVIFSGRTGEPIVKGLTRPHSAKLYKGKIYVNNSGYGEFGLIEDGKFKTLVTLPGWTRGLCIYKDIAFIGVSRVLPKFRQYAPGISNTKQVCSIFAFSLTEKKICGKIEWPFGNQVFGIDYIDNSVSKGFYYETTAPVNEIETTIFYTSK